MDNENLPSWAREKLHKTRSEILDMETLDIRKSKSGESVNVSKFTPEDIFRYHAVLYKIVDIHYGGIDQVPDYKNLKTTPRDLSRNLSLHKDAIDILSKYIGQKLKESL